MFEGTGKTGLKNETFYEIGLTFL